MMAIYYCLITDVNQTKEVMKKTWNMVKGWIFFKKTEYKEKATQFGISGGYGIM
jgi:hypothetical protein